MMPKLWPDDFFSPDFLERQELGDLQHVGPDGADDLEPVRELEEVLRDEGRYRVSVIRAVDLCRAEAVDDQEAGLAGGRPVAQLAQPPEAVEGLQDSLHECSARVCHAARKREQVLEPDVGANQLVVGGQLGGLRHLKQSTNSV